MRELKGLLTKARRLHTGTPMKFAAMRNHMRQRIRDIEDAIMEIEKELQDDA